MAGLGQVTERTERVEGRAEAASRQTDAEIRRHCGTRTMRRRASDSILAANSTTVKRSSRRLAQHELCAAEQRHRLAAGVVTVASQICVVPPLCASVASHAIVPSCVVRRKFVFDSIVVKPVPPSGRPLMGVMEWAWNAVQGPDGWHCPTGQYGEGGPLLIRSYDGTPTVMGSVFRTWIAGASDVSGTF